MTWANGRIDDVRRRMHRAQRTQWQTLQTPMSVTVLYHALRWNSVLPTCLTLYVGCCGAAIETLGGTATAITLHAGAGGDAIAPQPRAAPPHAAVESMSLQEAFSRAGKNNAPDIFARRLLIGDETTARC
jgi:hypothetical protein